MGLGRRGIWEYCLQTKAFGLPMDSGLGVASQRRMVGACQLAVGVGGARGNLGALPANEGFLVASGKDWGRKGDLGALPVNEGFLLAGG